MGTQQQTIGETLTKNRGCTTTVAIGQNGRRIFGKFDSSKGQDYFKTLDPNAWQARYGIDIKAIKGNLVGERASRDVLEEKARLTGDPLELVNHLDYIATDMDLTDTKFVAMASNRNLPVWDGLITKL